MPPTAPDCFSGVAAALGETLQRLAKVAEYRFVRIYGDAPDYIYDDPDALPLVVQYLGRSTVWLYPRLPMPLEDCVLAPDDQRVSEWVEKYRLFLRVLRNRGADELLEQLGRRVAPVHFLNVHSRADFFRECPREACICGAQATKVCARCRAKHYCGPECQKKDWGEHKQTCSATQPATPASIRRSFVRGSCDGAKPRKAFPRTVADIQRIVAERHGATRTGIDFIMRLAMRYVAGLEEFSAFYSSPRRHATFVIDTSEKEEFTTAIPPIKIILVLLAKVNAGGLLFFYSDRPGLPESLIGKKLTLAVPMLGEAGPTAEITLAVGDHSRSRWVL